MSARKATKPSNASQEDSEDYWNKSALTKFNFDDEEDEDTIEVTNWDGSSANPDRPHSQTSQKTKASTIATAVSARAFRGKTGSASQSVKFSARGGASMSNSVVSPLESSKNETPQGVSTTVLAKLETERNTLRKQLTQAKRERATAPSKQETLKRFMLGESVVKELYRSVEDKTALLDAAIRRHDGNAILSITLFMRNTLKRELFSKELMSRPVAVDHYCAYLQAISEIEELHEILMVLGRTEEAAMLKYRHCLKCARSPEVRMNALKDCIKYYFDSDPRLANETREIQDQVSLLNRQNIIDDNDSKTQESEKPSVFKTHPRRENLTNKSVITTLYYCCYYHWGEPEGILSSPQSIKNEYRVAEKAFVYTAIAALCRMRKWRDLEQVLTIPKSLFRGPRLHAVMGFDKVVDVLSKNLAPPDAIQKYCAEIETSDVRLEMAQKLKCHKVVIDTLVYQKDRQRLMSYLNYIPDTNQHMRQYLLSESRKPETKWKN
uniref:spermatogenesis-defective protein 39 homolog n=1 Tax=Styela clava TaxID=7725 RepID=UPI00193A1B1D|nr:spermatogenesis-defective protein 39 homolog [Styela clava]